MAEILKDQIVCDESDPILSVRLPAQLLRDVEDAALFRGATVQDLVCEFLYDNFIKVFDARGVPQGLNKAEDIRRKRLRDLRWDQQRRDRTERVTHQRKLLAVQREKRDQWAAYQLLREENMRALVEKELEVTQFVRRRPSRSTQELKMLDALHKDRAFIDTGDSVLRTYSRAKSEGGGTRNKGLGKPGPKSKNGKNPTV